MFFDCMHDRCCTRLCFSSKNSMFLQQLRMIHSGSDMLLRLVDCLHVNGV